MQLLPVNCEFVPGFGFRHPCPEAADFRAFSTTFPSTTEAHTARGLLIAERPIALVRLLA